MLKISAQVGQSDQCCTGHIFVVAGLIFDPFLIVDEVEIQTNKNFLHKKSTTEEK